MEGITWTMNCVLFGAKIIRLIEAGKLDEAKNEIKNLTSEFDDKTADYLIMRLQEL